jgi:LysR family transcriptional regulator, salicylic acid-responsive activator of bsdBCD
MVALDRRNCPLRGGVQPAARPLLEVGPQRADAGRTRGMDRSEVESHGLQNIDPDRAAGVDQLDLAGIGGNAPEDELVFSAHIRVGFTALGVEPVADMIEQMRGEQLGVSFSLHQGEPKMLEDMIEQRELDFAISHLPVANPALQVHPLAALQVTVILRKEAEARFPSERPLDHADLSETPLVLLRRNSGLGNL